MRSCYASSPSMSPCGHDECSEVALALGGVGDGEDAAIGLDELFGSGGGGAAAREHAAGVAHATTERVVGEQLGDVRGIAGDVSGFCEEAGAAVLDLLGGAEGAHGDGGDAE